MSACTKPLVSVLIPSYNRPDTIARAVEGITTQTYDNLEILISDNASPDARVDNILRQYAEKDDRITYVRHPTNEGPYRQGPFFESWRKGDYFLLCCDDDYYHPRYIEKMLDLHQQGDYAVATAQCDCYDMHSGRTFRALPIDHEMFGKSAEDSFCNFIALHHHYCLRGPIFLWGLYKTGKVVATSNVIFGFLKDQLDKYGTDNLYAMHTIANGNVILSPEVLWTRQERFYWGPGHEPWKRNFKKKCAYVYWKLRKNVRYRTQFFLGNVSDEMLSIELTCLYIKELARQYGFNEKRVDNVIRAHKAEWIRLLT